MTSLEIQDAPDRANNFLYPKLTGKTRSQWLIDATIYAHAHARPLTRTCRKPVHSDRCKCTRCASITAHKATFLHDRAGWNYSVIGRVLKRDHSTIMWAIDRLRQKHIAQGSILSLNDEPRQTTNLTGL